MTKGTPPTNKIVLPRKELEQEYKNHSAKEVAKYFKVSSPTVLRNLREYGIPVRRSGAPEQMPEGVAHHG